MEAHEVDPRRRHEDGELFDERFAREHEAGAIPIRLVHGMLVALYCKSISFVMLLTAACAQPAGELTTDLGGTLPANGNLVVFGRPPLDITFLRLDPGPSEALTHTTVGGGIALTDLAFIVELGGATPGTSITVQALCGVGCFDIGEVSIGLADDTTAPVLEDADLFLTARGRRDGLLNPFITLYDVSLETSPIIEDGDEVFFRFQSFELDVLSPSNGNGTSFLVQSAVPRPLCMTISLIDAAGNESVIAEQECVVLDPMAAPVGGFPAPG